MRTSITSVDTRAPRLLTAVLRGLLGRAAADAVIGDVLEQQCARQAHGGRLRGARVRITGALFVAVAASLWRIAPRTMRVAGFILRDAARSVRRSPAHSLFVMGILALGIALATVTFSVVDAVLFKPLPFDHPERLVSIRSSNFPERPFKSLTPANYFDMLDRSRTLEGLGSLSIAMRGQATVDGVTNYLDYASVSGDLLRVLGVSTAIGRLWTRDEAAAHTGGVVLGYAFWQQRFGGDPNVLGKSVTIGPRTLPIIGVLSAATDTTDYLPFATPIWAPSWLARDSPAGAGIGGPIGRMRPHVTPEDVAAEIQQIGQLDWRPKVTRTQDDVDPGVRTWLLLALGAAVVVVLIACVNAANLMLARASQRAQEMAVRASLGASRARVAASVVMEGVLLAGGATLAAVTFSAWGVAAARRTLTAVGILRFYRVDAVTLNMRVLSCAIAAAVITGVLFALVPAQQLSRVSIVDALKAGGPGATRGGRRWRSGFLIAEIAGVSILVVVSWLFVTSLVRAFGVDLGIDRTHLLAVNPRLQFKGTVDDVQARLERIPGVTGVAVSRGSALPLFGAAFSGAWWETTLAPAGAVGAPALTALDNRVSANYFSIAGLAMLKGGGWSSSIGPDENPVVIDDRVASLLFGDADPIGRPITATEHKAVSTVVGVVPYVRGRGPEQEVMPSAYFPLRADPTRNFAALLLRTAGSSDALMPAVTDAMAPFAPAQPEAYIGTGADAMRRLTATRRFNALLMSLFGAAGLLIGAAGIYAVMAAAVAQQRRELGVRMALGATPTGIRRTVLGRALRHIGLGLAIGLPAAWWASRAFASLLFHVTPADVSVYAGVAALLGLVAVLAAWLPARRASRIDPIVSIRQ